MRQARQQALENEAAEAAVASGAAPSTPATPRVRKPRVAKGPITTISLGRKYRDVQAPLGEDGILNFSKIIDKKGKAIEVITAATHNTERVLPYATLVKHFNATVLTPLFGAPLKFEWARMIYDGMADQILVLADQGFKPKLANLATFYKKFMNDRQARNPKTNETIGVPGRWTLKAVTTRSAKFYFASTAK